MDAPASVPMTVSAGRGTPTASAASIRWVAVVAPGSVHTGMSTPSCMQYGSRQTTGI